MKFNNWKTWWICILLVLLLTGLVYITWQYGLPFIELAKNPSAFRLWLNEQGIFSACYMIGIIFLQIVIAFIPGEPFELAAGYAFRFWEGTLLCLLGSALASGIIMLLVRKWGTPIIYMFFSKEKIDELWILKDQRRLNFWTFVAYLIPGSPKDVITYAMGLTNMKPTTFMLISTIARIPSIVTSTFSGNALGEQNYTTAILSFLFTMLISCIGIGIYAAIAKKKQKKMQLLKTAVSQ